MAVGWNETIRPIFNHCGQCTWSQWWFSLSVWDFGIAAIFFSMHIWNLIHDAPFHCHRNVTALSPENTGCHLTTKCHSGTLTQAPKEKSELKQLILMTTKCFSSIKMKMIYTSCRFLLLLWISILKRKINFLYVKNLRQCDTFKNSPFKESFCWKLACHSTFLNTW